MAGKTAFRAWAIRHWKRGLYPESVRETRSQCIADFIDTHTLNGVPMTRKDWDKDRWATVHRCVPVLVMEIETRRAPNTDKEPDNG